MERRNYWYVFSIFGISSILIVLSGCIDTGFFNSLSLIPAEIVVIDNGNPKRLPTGNSTLLTNDTDLKLSGISKPDVKIKVYTSPSDPQCENPPEEDNLIGTGETSGIDFEIALSTLPEGTYGICMYAEASALSDYAKILELVIKRSVQPFSGVAVLPQPRSPDREPRFVGNGEPASTLTLFVGGSCSGTPLEYAKVPSDGSFILPISKLNSLLVDGSVNYSILATDSIGNKICSVDVPYTLDTTISATTISAINPASPGNSDLPVISGTTELNSQVKLYNSSLCEGPVFASATTDPTGAFTLNLDNALTTETTYAFTVEVTDDLGNKKCFTEQARNYRYDVTPPDLDIISPANHSLHTGSFELSLSCEEDAKILVTGDVASDVNATCTNGSVIVSPTFSTPDGTKNIQVTASDAAGNTTTKNLSLVRDTTPPALPTITRTSASPTSSAIMDMTIADCSDIAEILIKEDSTIPTGLEPEWQTCSSVAGGTHYDLSVSAAQGTRNIRVFVRDTLKNMQTSYVSVLVDYDTLPPSIGFNAIPPFLGTNSYYEFVWTLTEGNVPAGANFIIQYSQDDGATWTNLASTPVGRTGAVNGKIYKYTQFLPSSPGSTLFRIGLTDATSQTGYGTNPTVLLYDITPPVITADSFKILESAGPVTTYNPFVKVSFSATDNQTPITQFCLKNVSTTPTLSDSCWMALDAPGIDVPVSQSVTLENYDYLVDWKQGTYTVYLWIRDQAGNISVNSGPINNGVDRISVTYSPVPDPSLKNLIVSKDPGATTQPSPWDLVTTPGTLLYLTWQQQVYMGSASVSLWYTTNGSDFTLIEDKAENGSKLTCSSGGGEQSCVYRWNSPVPVNTTYMVQVRVSDGLGQTTIKNTVYISNPNFRPIAGNTDPGTNGSAKKAAFRGLPNDSGSFIVTRNGTLFFRDVSRGLLMVDPTNGVQKVVLKNNGVTTGDGGPLSEATSQGILKIALDFQDRVLVFEPDRIRRIDTRVSPMTIETIIGAFEDGRVGTNTADYVVDPREVKIKFHEENKMAGHGDPTLTFLALPNGDIYFQSEKLFTTRANGARIRVYRGSALDPYVDTLRLGGAGDAGSSADIGSWAQGAIRFVFDPFSNAVSKALVSQDHTTPGCGNFYYANISPTTLQSLGGGHPSTPFSTCATPYTVQGMNGQIYALNRQNPWSFQIVKFDGGTGWNAIIGNGARASCADGTAALSCPIIPNDMFVSQTGQIYFMDDGQLRILGSDGLIYTLYGYNLSTGDGGPGMEARFNQIASLGHGVNDKVILLDTEGGRFREIDPFGSPGVKTIAGTGADGPSSTTPLGVAANVNPIGMGWSTPGRFASNPATGDVYWHCGGSQSICMLNRASNVWQNIFTLGGSSAWESASNIYISSLEAPPYPVAPFAFVDGYIGFGLSSWSGQDNNRATIREVRMSDGLTKHLAGNSSEATSATCPNGAATNCGLDGAFYGYGQGQASPTFYKNQSGTNYWLIVHNGHKDIHRVGGGTAQKLFTIADRVQSMLYRDPYFYYCSMPVNTPAKLYRKEMTSPYKEVELVLPHNTTCTGNNILFKEGSGGEPDRLVFPVKQNAISGVAEFLDPENYQP